MTKTLINVLVNNHWVLMPEKNLQPGSGSFPFKAGLYETIRTLEHKPVFLKPDHGVKSAIPCTGKNRKNRFE